MPFEPKCVLVTGGTSEGIGKALALAMLDLPSSPKVIITGRRQDRLDEICKQYGGGRDGRLLGKRLDQSSSKQELQSWAKKLAQEFPELDTVILNAGVQYATDWTKPDSINLDDMDKEVYTNYTSTFALITGFLPHMLQMAKEGRQVPRLVTVTSGLSIVPKPSNANYCATKAALHSLTLSLRAQLAGVGVKVIEIAPPLVESQLHDDQGTTEALKKFWMPLDKFTNSVMDGLKAEKDVLPIGTSEKDYEEHERRKHDKVAARV